jgi:hypothetical protein
MKIALKKLRVGNVIMHLRQDPMTLKTEYSWVGATLPPCA